MSKKMKIGITVGAVVIIALIIVIALLANVSNTEPRDYEEKVEKMAKAIYSKSKMEEVIEDEIVDLITATAWQNIVGNYSEPVKIDNLKNELKNVKKDDDRVKELKNALVDYVESREKNNGSEVKVTNIKKPKQNQKNKKIWTIKAEIDDYEYVFIFYNGKIIDFTDDFEEDSGDIKMESLFQYMLEYYHL